MKKCLEKKGKHVIREKLILRNQQLKYLVKQLSKKKKKKHNYRKKQP